MKNLKNESLSLTNVKVWLTDRKSNKGILLETSLDYLSRNSGFLLSFLNKEKYIHYSLIIVKCSSSLPGPCFFMGVGM